MARNFQTIFEYRAEDKVTPSLQNMEASMSRLSSEFKQLGKRTGTDFDIAGKSVDELRKEMDRLEKEATKVGNVDIATDLKRQAKIIETAMGEKGATRSIKDVAAELKQVQNAAKATNDASRLSQLNKQAEELRGELRRLKGTGLPDFDAKQQAGGRGRGGGNIKESLKNAGGSAADRLGLGGLAGAATPIGAAAAGVGALGAAAISLGNQAAEVDKLTRSFVQLDDVSQDTAQELAGQTTALARTFGKDVTEMQRAARSLSKQMDISLTDALGQVERGFKNGADANDEFLSTLKEFPSALQGTGASAEQLVNVATLSAREGVFNDKGVDAVKEASIRLREQTNSTRDALKGAFGKDFTQSLLDRINSGDTSLVAGIEEVSEQMKQTSLTAKQEGTLIADVFGAAGEDAGKGFVEGLSRLSEGVEESVKPAQERMLELQKEFANAQAELGEFTGAGKDSFEALALQAKTLSTQGLSAIIDAFEQATEVADRFGTVTKNALDQGGQSALANSLDSLEDNKGLEVLKAATGPLGAAAISITEEGLKQAGVIDRTTIGGVAKEALSKDRGLQKQVETLQQEGGQENLQAAQGRIDKLERGFLTEVVKTADFRDLGEDEQQQALKEARAVFARRRQRLQQSLAQGNKASGFKAGKDFKAVGGFGNNLTFERRNFEEEASAAGLGEGQSGAGGGAGAAARSEAKKLSSEVRTEAARTRNVTTNFNAPIFGEVNFAGLGKEERQKLLEQFGREFSAQIRTAEARLDGG